MSFNFVDETKISFLKWAGFKSRASVKKREGWMCSCCLTSKDWESCVSFDPPDGITNSKHKKNIKAALKAAGLG